MCDPCGAGTYTPAAGPSGAMSFFTLASGTGHGDSFASNSPAPAGFTTEHVIGDTLVLDAAGNVTSWALELRTGPGGNYVATDNQSFVQDFANQSNINESISTTPGTWSCLTDNEGACGLSPAPGPLPGAAAVLLRSRHPRPWFGGLEAAAYAFRRAMPARDLSSEIIRALPKNWLVNCEIGAGESLRPDRF
jgi:hypothetical protein